MNLEPITIEPSDIALINAFNAKREGVASFVQNIMMAGEKRNADLIEEGRAMWTALAAKYGLDVQRVSYELRGDKITPVAARFQ